MSLAPGKVILSGEHAVVYGKPALATSVNRFVKTNISARLDDKIQFNDRILTLQELHTYSKTELIYHAFIYLVENLSLDIKRGLKIQVESTLPIGCGMGSSAAIIISLMRALTNYFNLSLSEDKYLHFGREIENFQHDGKSSGVDVFLSLHGGCYFINGENRIKRNTPNIPITLVNTGKPQSSTGECISAAAKYFQGDSITEDFAKVTTAMDIALQQDNLSDVMQCIRENHKLLKYIEVVPDKVCKFISAIEGLGNAAKISGAGAVSGSNAGIVLVVVGETEILDIIREYGYEIL